MGIRRRDFLIGAGGILGASGAVAPQAAYPTADTEGQQSSSDPADDRRTGRTFNGPYEGDYLKQIAFPLGGLGAGMFCVEGNGALTKFSLRNRPELTAPDPHVFAAIALRGTRKMARVLEGPVPAVKLQPQFTNWPPSHWGLPRFEGAEFCGRFPFAAIRLQDDEVPLTVELTAWSPFEPGDADNASLPVAGLEYAFTNRTERSIDAMFSFNAENFLALSADNAHSELPTRDRVFSMACGFNLYGAGTHERPWDTGNCAIWVDDPLAQIDHVWFPVEPVRMLWNTIESGALRVHPPLADESSAGASIFVPVTTAPGETKVVRVRFAWYFPTSNLYRPERFFQNNQTVHLSSPPNGTYRPWYAGRFKGIEDVVNFWQERYASLRRASDRFSRALQDSTLPPEALEAVAANLSILKSPTCLRQVDGLFWGFEGTGETTGYAEFGNDAVWNYGQALAHLFPVLERGVREVELAFIQNDQGQMAVGSALPIRRVEVEQTGWTTPFPEQQFGSIVKFYREWRISGDTDWLGRWWHKIRASMDCGIQMMDPDRRGWVTEPHGSTYDNILWGPDSMCTSIYLAGLKAAIEMGETLREHVEDYERLLKSGLKHLEGELFNGEYFFQKVQWQNLRTHFPEQGKREYLYFSSTSEGLELAKKEGPFGQWGPGCLSDGIHGAWLLLMAGAGGPFDSAKVKSHLEAVYRHNFKSDLSGVADCGRAVFAAGHESGLLNCTWPRGGRPSLPTMDVFEVWTGIEYEVASHLIAVGKVNEGLELVRAVRQRYDGRVRNPFAEVEWGHWYCRALSSYALLAVLSGARYDAVEKILYLQPAIRGDFRCFLSTATGYGTVGVKSGEPFLEVVAGEIACRRVQYTPASR